jgi:hypothetical protein
MKYKIFMSFFISFTIILSGCSVIGTGKKGEATNTYKPNFDDFNPGRLEYKKLHVIVPALNAVPQNFQAHTDTVKEMNEILLSVINTEIEFEHVIYHNQIQEIYEKVIFRNKYGYHRFHTENRGTAADPSRLSRCRFNR